MIYNLKQKLAALIAVIEPQIKIIEWHWKVAHRDKEGFAAFMKALDEAKKALGEQQ